MSDTGPSNGAGRSSRRGCRRRRESRTSTNSSKASVDALDCNWTLRMSAFVHILGSLIRIVNQIDSDSVPLVILHTRVCPCAESIRLKHMPLAPSMAFAIRSYLRSQTHRSERVRTRCILHRLPSPCSSADECLSYIRSNDGSGTL